MTDNASSKNSSQLMSHVNVYSEGKPDITTVVKKCGWPGS